MAQVVSFHRSGNYWIRKARESRASGQILSALELYRRAAEQDAGDLDARMGMACMYTAMGLPDDSDRILHSISDRQDAPEERFLLLSKNAFLRGEVMRAQGYLSRYLGEDPDGNRLRGASDYVALLAQTDLTLREGSRQARRASHLVALAMRRYESGDFSQAARLSRRAARLGGDAMPARTLYALSLSRTGRKARALPLIRRLMERCAGQPSYALTLIRALFYAGGVEAARKAFDALGKPGPDDAQCLAMIDVAILLGDEARIGELLGRARRIAPYDRKLLHAMAVRILRRDGNRKAASDCWMRILRIDPEDPVAASCLERLVKGAPADSFGYGFRLEESERRRRHSVLQTAALMTTAETQLHWNRSVSLKTLCRWALRSGDPQSRTFARVILARVDDGFARQLLSEDVAARRDKPLPGPGHTLSCAADPAGEIVTLPLRWRHTAHLAMRMSGDSDRLREGLLRYWAIAGTANPPRRPRAFVRALMLRLDVKPRAGLSQSRRAGALEKRNVIRALGEGANQ